MAAAPGPNAKRCWTVKAKSSELIACRAVPRGIEGRFPERLCRPQVHSLELQFEDGDSVNLDLLEDYFLYQIPRSHWSRGQADGARRAGQGRACPEPPPGGMTVARSLRGGG